MQPKKKHVPDNPTTEWERSNAREWDETSEVIGCTVAGYNVGNEPAHVEASGLLIDFDDEAPSTPHRAPATSSSRQPAVTALVGVQMPVRSRPLSAQPPPKAEHHRPPPQIRPNGSVFKARDLNSTSTSQYSKRPQSGHISAGKSSFAPGARFATSRLADTQEAKEKQQKSDNEYLGEPTEDVHIAVQACYLWPLQDQLPSQLLGLTLEDLNYIRIDFRVWIVWNAKLYSLVITSRPWPEKEMAQNNVTKALKAVRESISHANARATMAAPLYIIAPPEVKAMRSSIRPIRYTKDFTMIELHSALLDNAEKVQWNTSRGGYLQKNANMFHGHIIRNLQKLSAVKGWMRMRVHFGHLNLSKWPKDFTQGAPYARFLDILDDPRAQAAAKFDKKLLSIEAVRSLGHHILANPDIFSTIWGTNFSLEKDVDFEHMLCLFFKTSQGIGIRMEIEMDSNSTNGFPEYQLGSIRFYKDNNRNKHIEIVNLDLEKKIDWAIEVITDNTINDPQPQWKRLVERAILSKTANREDSIGLAYPGATLPVHGGLPPIDRVVIKSAIEYKIQKSGYSLETAVYRQWNGHDTRPEPEIQASVSMYHPNWDDEMRSLEGTAYTRDWDRDLSQLFIQGEDGANGIKVFLADVEAIRGYLSDASKAYFDGLMRPEFSTAASTGTA